MKYYTTKNQQIRYSFDEAVIKGLAPDRGLFFPERIPLLAEDFFKNLGDLSLPQIGFEIAQHFTGDVMDQKTLQRICEEAFSFPIPLVEVEKGIYSMELFHGPTCAFKDVGARFMSRCLSHFVKKQKQKLHILVATSGDTGSAVASGFLDVEGIEVIILYPKAKVSKIQEQQLTTMGRNITALEVEGSFDDCQGMVKQAFSDSELRQKMNLSSANSINIARLLPQSFYYFYAWGQLQAKGKEIVVSVPSGNYGNLTGGLLAKKMGLPIHCFIAAANRNKIVPDYLQTGNFEPKASVPTLSNAMDVGDPSNFSRMMELYAHSHQELVKDLKGAWYTDEQTVEVIQKVDRDHKYLLDPHGALAYLGLKEHLNVKDQIGVFLETAHPAKFLSTVEEAVGREVEIPEFLQACLQKEKQAIPMSKEFEELKDFLFRR